jgi:formate dehydrogenase maturation protein FdhE
MRSVLASHIMARTTLNLDDPVLADLKRLQRKEGKPLGDLASELLASAIASRKSSAAPVARLQWTSRGMGALVDLDDKEALYRALDHEPKRRQK